MIFNRKYLNWQKITNQFFGTNCSFTNGAEFYSSNGFVCGWTMKQLWRLILNVFHEQNTIVLNWIPSIFIFAICKCSSETLPTQSVHERHLGMCLWACHCQLAVSGLKYSSIEIGICAVWCGDSSVLSSHISNSALKWYLAERSNDQCHISNLVWTPYCLHFIRLPTWVTAIMLHTETQERSLPK